MNDIQVPQTYSRKFDQSMYDFERVADLKAVHQYQKRLISRLTEESTLLQTTVETQLSIIDEVNSTFATSHASTCCTNSTSPVFKTLNSYDDRAPIPITQSFKNREQLGDLYLPPSTGEILRTLEQVIDFQSFFFDYPLAYIAVFGKEKMPFDTEEIIKLTETWSYEKRIDFYTSFFEHINSIAFIFSSFMSLIDSQSIAMLGETIETGMSHVLNCSRATFYRYDPEINELIMEKQKLQMRHKLSDGYIYYSLKLRKSALLVKEMGSYAPDDEAIMKNSKVVLVTPVICDNIPTGVILLHDKIGGFKTIDFLIATALANFISFTIPYILQIDNRRKCVEVFQQTLDSYLKLIGANDFGSFKIAIPKTFCEHFHCENVTMWKISKKTQTFSRLDSEKNQKERIPINTGIVGQSILKKEPIKMNSPELSIYFRPDVDRFKPEIFTSSILVCPINSKDGSPKWVVSLYNKIDVDEFSDFDTKTLKMMCNNLTNILESTTQTQKLTRIVEHTRQKLHIFSSVIDILPLLNNLQDFYDTSQIIMKKMSTCLNYSEAYFYIVDDIRQTICSCDPQQQYHSKLVDNDADPVSKFALNSGIKESIPTDDKPPNIYCGMKDVNGEPSGAIRFVKSNQISQGYASSMFQSSISVFTMSQHFSKNKLASQKSAVEVKIEKLNTILTSQFQEVSDPSFHQVLKVWRNIIGPIFGTAMKYRRAIERSSICMNLIEDLPENPNIAMTIFNDLQLFFISPETDEESCFKILPYKTQGYNEKTKKLVDSFSTYFDKYSIPEINDPQNPLPTGDINGELYSNTYCVFKVKEDEIINHIERFFIDFGLLEVMHLGEFQIENLIKGFRKIHSTHSFQNWEMCLDHIQFSAFILKQLDKANTQPPENIIALFFYLMSLYSDPFVLDPMYSQQMKTKFNIENGTPISSISCLYLASNFTGKNILKDIPGDVLNKVFEIMKELEKSNSFDLFYSGGLINFIVELSCFSYLARNLEDTEQWVKYRFQRELQNDDEEMREDLKKFQLDFEVRSIILPACGEFVKKGIKFDLVRKLFTTNVSKITGNQF